MVSGTGKFGKVYHEEQTDNKTKFSFKHIQELCNKFPLDEFKNNVLNDYNEYKINYGKVS